MAILTVRTDLRVVNCGECGGTYAIGSRYHAEKRETGGTWNCPYCKVDWGFSDSGENAQLKKQLLRQQAQHDQTRAAISNSREQYRLAESRRRAQRGANTKLKNRIAKGVCPCCSRSFQNLHRHMTNQHPDWAKSDLT